MLSARRVVAQSRPLRGCRVGMCFGGQGWATFVIFFKKCFSKRFQRRFVNSPKFRKGSVTALRFSEITPATEDRHRQGFLLKKILFEGKKSLELQDYKREGEI